MYSSPLSCYLVRLSPNIFLSPWFSVNVSDQVSHLHKTTGKIIVLYIFFFIFLDNKLEDKGFCAEKYETLPDFSLLLISSWIKFSFVLCFTQIFKSILIKNSTRCNRVSKFYDSIFIWSPTCWTLSGRVWEGAGCNFPYSAWQRPATTRPKTFHVCKTRGC
jgi:hypothetical protein